MTEQPGWRPEQTLTLAILVAVAGVAAAAILIVGHVLRGGQMEDMVPTGLVLVGGGVLAALVINLLGKRAARKHRPEWLETQAWQSGLSAKLAAGQKRDDSASKRVPPNPAAAPPAPEEKDPRRG